MLRKLALLGFVVLLVVGLLISGFVGGSFDPKYNDWMAADNFVENLSTNPSAQELSNAIGLARRHEHWIVRYDAVNYLGHIGGQNLTLILISVFDSNKSVRNMAAEWIQNPAVQALKYRLDRDKTNPFGQTWDPLGSVTAVIAAIDEKTTQTIGLTAMQMRNLSVETASISIVTSTKRVQVPQYYNAFGEQSSGGAGIRISKDLAEELQLKVGDTITIVSEGKGSVVPA